MESRWTAVDQYLTELLVAQDLPLRETLRAAERAGLPPISVSPPQGKLLYLLAKTMGAKSILEIGTLAGYSTIWMARGLAPRGRLITLEIDPRHAAVARANIDAAGVGEAVSIEVGPAHRTLDTMIAGGGGAFDLVFIDADKVGYPRYLGQVMRLTRPGSLIIADNVVRDGAVIDPGSADENVQAVRAYHDLIASDHRLEATVIQTVGAKGYDGLSIARVVSS